MKYFKYIFLAVLLGFSNQVFTQELENLGHKLNTMEYQECFPTISPDGKTLFFSRQNNPDSKGGYDIYYSELDATGNWSEAKTLDIFNNSVKNIIYDISPDGNQIVLVGKYGKTPTDKGLSISNKTEKGWSEPEAIPFENEGAISWGNNACTMSPNGNVMIISLSGDLHVSFKNNEGIWSHPKAFESNINTSSNEYSPFLSTDNKTLYFSGGGHGGLGNNDIFKTTRQDDSWTKWSNPENLGTPINSSAFESFFRLAAKGDYAYVYSLTNKGDLYRIKLKEEIRPNPVVLVKGKVLDSKTLLPIKGSSITYIQLSDGKVVGTAKSNPETGEYQIILAYGNQYGFSAESKGYISVSENIDLSQINEYQEITKDLFLTPIEVGSVVRLNNIFFDVGKATLRPESNPELDRVVKILNENPELKIEIGGHTDSDGSDDLNKKLSADRALAVKNYIISKGTNQNRITSVGYGETKAQVPNTTPENKQLNRRVEFKITQK